MTSTVDSCCQRAKVHRLVTLPEQSCKMSWSCCGIFFSGVCVNFEYLEIWIHYFSKCNSAHHYFSKSNSVSHYLISSKCKKFYFSFLNVSQRLSFVLLGMKQCPIVVSKQLHIYLLFLEYLIMFQMPFLIMYKTSRFWPLV